MDPASGHDPGAEESGACPDASGPTPRRRPRVDDPASFLTLLHGGEQRGTIFVARKPTVNPEDFRNDPYPVARLDEAAAAIVAWSRDAETYVSVAVFDGGGRERTNIKHLPFLWLDRDEKPFCAALPEPTLTLETSPGRFQDFWQLCDIPRQRRGYTFRSHR